MAQCPKCGRKLSLRDWKPDCPDCGVNLVYYEMEETLLAEAEAAEIEHAHMQKRFDRLKAAFIGSKLTIARIVLSLLPIGMLMLPLCRVTNVSQETTKINAIEIYNVVSKMDFNALLAKLGSGAIGTGLLGYVGSLVCILLSLVFVILSLLMLMIACGRRGNARNLTLNAITIVLAGASAVFFNMFAGNCSEVSPEYAGGAVDFGIFAYIAALLALLIINIVITNKGMDIKYKQCYIGGIPSEEYFELVKAGTDKETMRAIMKERIAAQLAQQEAEEAKKKEKAKEKT